MKKSILLLSCTLIIGTLLTIAVASPAILYTIGTTFPNGANGSQITSGPLTKNLGAKIDLIPLTGTANAPTPYDIIHGSVYTTVMLRSLQTYEFRFALNTQGIFSKVIRADLWIFSQDCYGCADKIDFAYAINGVSASASIGFPGISTQGPVTNVVALPLNTTSAINGGLNDLSLDLIQATILSDGTVLTDFPFGVYEMALFIDYQTLI